MRRATAMVQQLHAIKWIREHLQSSEFQYLQEPRLVTHMLLIVVSMIMAAPFTLYPLLSDDQWCPLLHRIKQKTHSDWDAAKAAAARIFKLALAGAAGWDKSKLHDLPAIAADGEILPNPASTVTCPNWLRLRLPDNDERSQWVYNQGSPQDWTLTF